MISDDQEVSQLQDVMGQHFESFFAMLVKLFPGEIGAFGVSHKFNVDGENYRYYSVVAREGHELYEELENEYEEVQTK